MKKYRFDLQGCFPRCFSKAPELLSPLLSVLKLVDSFTETDVSAPYEVSSAVAEEVSPTGNKKPQPMGSKEAQATGNKKLKAAARMVSSSAAPASMMSSYAACKIMSSDTGNSMPLAAAEEVSSAIMEIEADKESPSEEVLYDDIEDVLVNSENSIADKSLRVLNPVSTISRASVMANKPNCDYCDRVFTSRRSLARHIEEYHLRKPNLLHCDFCKLTFRRKEHFENQLKSKGCLKNKGLIYECKFCKKTFSSPEKLKTHMNKNCLKKYFCNICLKFFSKQKDLQSHAH